MNKSPTNNPVLDKIFEEHQRRVDNIFYDHQERVNSAIEKTVNKFFLYFIGGCSLLSAICFGFACFM